MKTTLIKIGEVFSDHQFLTRSVYIFPIEVNQHGE